MNTSSPFIDRRAFDSWVLASPLNRSIAFLIDLLAVAIIVAVISMDESSKVQCSYFLLFFILWDLSWNLYSGASLGKRLMKIKVFSPKLSGKPSLLQTFIRSFSFWLSILPAGIGLTPIIFRKDRRAWHDLLSETLCTAEKNVETSKYMQDTFNLLYFIQAALVMAVIIAFLLSQI